MQAEIEAEQVLGIRRMMSARTEWCEDESWREEQGAGE